MLPQPALSGPHACVRTPSPLVRVCVLADVHSAMQTRIKLDWKTGVAATDWSSIAKKEHLDTLTMELRRLEDIIREVYSEMLMLQQREQEMRDISGGCGGGGRRKLVLLPSGFSRSLAVDTSGTLCLHYIASQPLLTSMLPV